jgi:hypothetical protein
MWGRAAAAQERCGPCGRLPQQRGGREGELDPLLLLLSFFLFFFSFFFNGLGFQGAPAGASPRAPTCRRR